VSEASSDWKNEEMEQEGKGSGRQRESDRRREIDAKIGLKRLNLNEI